MLKNVAVIVRGNVIAQIVGVLVLPILTRHFSPVAFGHFQVFQSVLGLTLVVATMRYEIAILRAETPRELGALLAICTGINLLVAAVLSIAYGIYARFLSTDPSQGLGFPFTLWITAFVLGGGIQYFGYVLVREELFSKNANSKIVQALTNAGTALVLALTSPVAEGIVIADVAGRLGALMAMVSGSVRALRPKIERPSRLDIAAALYKFRAYPLITMPGGLVNMAAATLTPILIYHMFDPATSGQFGLLERSAALPIGLISVAISQVYMAQLASDLRTHDRQMVQRFDRLVRMLTLITLPPAVVTAVFSHRLFSLIFGPGWEQAASFAQLMMLSYCLSMISGPINMTLVVVGWQKCQLAWEIARMIAMSTLWLVGARLGWSVNSMVAGHSVILAAFGMATLILSRWALVESACTALARDDLMVGNLR